MSDPDQGLRVLVADDEESMRHFVTKGLTRLGHEVVAVADGVHALATWQAAPSGRGFDVVVLDVRMPGADGTTVLSQLRSLDPDTVVVLISAHGTVATAVEAMHLGAADFVQKPFAIEELQLRIRRAVELRQANRERQQLRALLQRPDRGLDLCVHSLAMRELVRQLDLAAASDSTVLLTGESGTGKGLLAKALHLQSRRHQGPFLAMNCAALPDTLAESELFGHVAGAFTGARSQRSGLLQRAHGGTLFLDEIGDMSATGQARIEHFLQHREFVPLGGERTVKVDVRIVAATNRDLREQVRGDRFRQELLYRLDVVTLHVPPLRERRDDVPHLIRAFLERSERADGPRHRLSPDALAVLCAWHWPGNVRELENAVERMIVLAGDREELGVADLPIELRTGDEAAAISDPAGATHDSYDAARSRFDRLFFENLLRRAGGNVTEAARLAGISRGHLHRRMKELSIGHGPST